MQRADLRLTLVAALLGLASPSSAATSGTGLPISDAVLQRQWTGAWIACPGAPERDPGVFRFRKVDRPRGRSAPLRRPRERRPALRPARERPSRRNRPVARRHSLLAIRDVRPRALPEAGAEPASRPSSGTSARRRPRRRSPTAPASSCRATANAEAAANTDASWECAPEPGHQPWPEGLKPLREEDPQYLVVGPGERLDAAQYDWERGAPPAPGAPAGRWQPAVVSAIATPRSIAEAPGYALTPDGRLLVPDELPPMEYRHGAGGSAW